MFEMMIANKFPFGNCWPLLPLFFQCSSNPVGVFVVFKLMHAGGAYPWLQKQVPFCVQFPCPLQSDGQAGLDISATGTHLLFLHARPSPHLTPSKTKTIKNDMPIRSLIFDRYKSLLSSAKVLHHFAVMRSINSIFSPYANSLHDDMFSLSNTNYLYLKLQKKALKIATGISIAMQMLF